MQVWRLTTVDGVDVWRLGYQLSDVVIPVGREDSGQAMPLSPVYCDDFYAKQEVGEEAWINSCDLYRKDGEVVLVPERQHDDGVLLLVEPTVPPGGHLVLEAVTFDETVVGSLKKHVERRYHPFPGVGTELLRQGRGPNDEWHALVAMLRGAAFRIIRGGKCGGHYPVTVVAWKGSELSVVPAAKFHKQVERERRQLGWEHRLPYYLPEPEPVAGLA